LETQKTEEDVAGWLGFKLRWVKRCKVGVGRHRGRGRRCLAVGELGWVRVGLGLGLEVGVGVGRHRGRGSGLQCLAVVYRG
jgi:hypothetical protein